MKTDTPGDGHPRDRHTETNTHEVRHPRRRTPTEMDTHEDRHPQRQTPLRTDTHAVTGCDTAETDRCGDRHPSCPCPFKFPDFQGKVAVPRGLLTGLVLPIRHGLGSSLPQGPGHQPLPPDHGHSPTTVSQDDICILPVFRGWGGRLRLPLKTVSPRTF